MSFNYLIAEAVNWIESEIHSLYTLSENYSKKLNEYKQERDKYKEVIISLYYSSFLIIADFLLNMHK